jgi:hypothetical protein
LCVDLPLTLSPCLAINNVKHNTWTGENIPMFNKPLDGGTKFARVASINLVTIKENKL